MKKTNESKRIEFTRVEHTSPLVALRGIMNGLVEDSDDIIIPFAPVKPLEDNTYCTVLTCPDIMCEQLAVGHLLAANKTANQILESFGNYMLKDRTFEQYECADLSYAIVCEGPQKTYIDLESGLEHHDGNYRGLLFSDEKFYHEDSGEFCDEEIMISEKELVELLENCGEYRLIITVRL